MQGANCFLISILCIEHFDLGAIAGYRVLKLVSLVLRIIFSVFGGLFALMTLGIVLAVVGLVGIFYAYGRDLPNIDQLASYEPAIISRVYSIDGQVIDEFAQERRLFTPADEIPDIVKQAFISAEDKGFYAHAGFDPIGILKALYDAAQGGRLRGASTITQQVTKNFLLDGSRKIERKVKEIILATRIESVLSKPQILELYLNEIFLGQNSYGVTAAADTYFGKPIEQISVAEAAYLAALPKAPSTYHPVRERKRAIARRNFVLREMFENGFIDSQDYQTARASDLVTVQSGDFTMARNKRQPRGYFTDEIRRQLSQTFGESEFFTGGMAVRATMDPDLQKVAERALRKGLEAYDRAYDPWRGAMARFDADALQSDDSLRAAFKEQRFARDIEGWSLAVISAVDKDKASVKIERGKDMPFALGILDYKRTIKTFANRKTKGGAHKPIRSAQDLWSLGDVVYVAPEFDKAGKNIGWGLRQIPAVQGAFVAMDPHTGRVLAMQGGFSYQNSVFNRVTQAQRQPGSSFKPFVYAAALDSGYSPSTIVVDAPIEIETPQGIWRPKNYSDKYYGASPLRVGIEKSRNLMTIRLAQDVGMDVVAQYAERFGVYDQMDEYISLALGAQESTLYRMVSAYAMFANGGERVQPTLVDRVQDRFGRSVFVHDQRACLDCNDIDLAAGYAPYIRSNRERIMDAITAYQLTSMMQGVVENGTGRRVAIDGVPIAGKTGTTNEARDVWFVGFSKNLVAGCYVGFDQPKPLAKGAGGGSICGPIFRDFMLEAIAKYGNAGEFAVPEGGHFVKFDRLSGVRLDEDAQGTNVISEFFRDGDESYLNEDTNVIDGGFSATVDRSIFNEFLRNQLTTEEREALAEAQAQEQAEQREALELSNEDPSTKDIQDDTKAQQDERTNFGSLTSGGTY